MGKVAVVGAGPAGIAATVQLVRAGHDVKVFEKGRVGGALWNARQVDNYPGFPEGISGPELATRMEKQLLSYIDEVIVNEVTEVERTDTGFTIQGKNFDGVILCTGTTPRESGFPSEAELREAGFLYYGIAEVEDWNKTKDVAIIGGGEASMDMALSLAEKGITVTVIHRSEPIGIKALKEAVFGDGRITWLGGEVKSAVIEEKAIKLLDDRVVKFDLVIVAVGREAVVPRLIGFSFEEPPTGLLIAGDAVRGSLGQVAMAVGDGVEAAMIMDRFLEVRT